MAVTREMLREAERHVRAMPENRTPAEGGTKDPTVDPHLSVASGEALRSSFRQDPDPDCYLCSGTGVFQMRSSTATCACAIRVPREEG